MDPLQAIDILVQVANAAHNKGGVVTLKESVILNQAIESISKLGEEIVKQRKIFEESQKETETAPAGPVSKKEKVDKKLAVAE